MSAPSHPHPHLATGYSLGQQLFTPPATMSRQLTTSVTHPNDSDSDSEDENSPKKLSEIHLKINTPLLIQGNNNHISIDTSVNAAKISLAVVNALRQMSNASGGVPMIDEDGRPRPIKIDVAAETRVVGSGNVVGDKAVSAKGGGAGEVQKVDGKEKEKGVGDKRERSGSESIGMDLKRAKRDG
jgi:hypothetical protein